MDGPVFSFVIPAFNEAQRIGLCLEALRRNEGPGLEFEVVVVDHGSTDRTVEIARESGAKTMVCPDRPRGFVGALRNIGARATSGRLLAFLDADMAVPPGLLRTVKETFDAGYRGVLGFPQAAPEGASWVGRIWERRNRHELGGTIPTISLSSSNMFVNRDVFEEAGGFDERLLSSEDKDLAFRVKQAGYESVRMPGPVLTHFGYDRCLRELIRKEAWRQGATLILALKHGLPLRLLRNPLLSLFHSLSPMLLVVAGLAGRIDVALISTALWFLPALYMAAFRDRNCLAQLDRLRLFFLFWLRWNVSGVVLWKQVFQLVFSGNARRGAAP